MYGFHADRHAASTDGSGYGMGIRPYTWGAFDSSRPTTPISVPSEAQQSAKYLMLDGESQHGKPFKLRSGLPAGASRRFSP